MGSTTKNELSLETGCGLMLWFFKRSFSSEHNIPLLLEINCILLLLLSLWLLITNLIKGKEGDPPPHKFSDFKAAWSSSSSLFRQYSCTGEWLLVRNIILFTLVVCIRTILPLALPLRKFLFLLLLVESADWRPPTASHGLKRGPVGLRSEPLVVYL